MVELSLLVFSELAPPSTCSLLDLFSAVHSGSKGPGGRDTQNHANDMQNHAMDMLPCVPLNTVPVDLPSSGKPA